MTNDAKRSEQMSEWLEQTMGYWGAGGPLLLPIGIVCLGIWGLFLRSRDVLARTIRDGDAVRKALHGGALGGTPQCLAEGLNAFPGGIAAMVSAAVNDMLGGSAPREAFEARENECMDLLRRDVVVLAALTAIAPLLGLLGTVMGMIETFDAVAALGGNTGTRVAAGISQALITTQFGLVVALPGVFGLARLQRMVRNAHVVMAECRSHVLQCLEGY
jgi:biopolymer transport protein ExbB